MSRITYHLLTEAEPFLNSPGARSHAGLETSSAAHLSLWLCVLARMAPGTCPGCICVVPLRPKICEGTFNACLGSFIAG